MNRFQKWVNLGLILSTLALGFLSYQMLAQVWAIFRLREFPDWPLSLPAIIAGVLALLILIIVKSNSKAMTFLNEVALELSKVTWPTYQETVSSTGVIIIMVGIAAVLMFLFDMLWVALTRSLIGL